MSRRDPEQPPSAAHHGTPIHGGATTRDGRRVPLPDIPAEQLPPGHGPILLLGLVVGLLLMGMQLWLLTIAFDLYLAGKRTDTVIVAVCSGFVFLGGLLMLAFVSRRPGRRA